LNILTYLDMHDHSLRGAIQKWRVYIGS